jgi:PBP1b-binding outer membrane lipoprotein LpoB
MIKNIFLMGILLFLGCSNSMPKKVDTKEICLTTIHWGSDDLQEMAQKIVQDILSSSTIDFSKTYSFGKIRNDSYDHIDTKLLKNKIIIALVQNGKVKISENSNHQSSGIFYGKISSILKKNSTTKDIFFNFNLNLTDVESNYIIWSEDVEIRKEQKKELIGW